MKSWFKKYNSEQFPTIKTLQLSKTVCLRVYVMCTTLECTYMYMYVQHTLLHYCYENIFTSELFPDTNHLTKAILTKALSHRAYMYRGRSSLATFLPSVTNHSDHKAHKSHNYCTMVQLIELQVLIKIQFPTTYIP